MDQPSAIPKRYLHFEGYPNGKNHGSGSKPNQIKNQRLEPENHALKNEHHLDPSRLGSSRLFFEGIGIGTFILFFCGKNSIFRWQVRLVLPIPDMLVCLGSICVHETLVDISEIHI